MKMTQRHKKYINNYINKFLDLKTGFNLHT